MMRLPIVLLYVYSTSWCTTAAYITRPFASSKPPPLHFIVPTNHHHNHHYPRGRRDAPSTWLAAKKGKKRSAGAGFGKVDKNSSSSSSSKSSSAPATTTTTTSQPPPQQDSSPFLQSVSEGGSTKIPVIEEPKQQQDNDSSAQLSAKERAANILREKYGMRTLEEQQTDAQQVARVQEQRKRLQEMKQKLDRGDDSTIDVMTLLPAPVLIALDRFLKIGVGVSGVLFVLAGLGITWEAWSKVSGNPLPDTVDALIVNTIEPNFSTGLLILLGFSVSLGIFSALQLSSAGAQYKEDK